MSPLPQGIAPDLVTLDATNVQVTRLCYGTSKLFRLHSSRERQRLLDAAFDAGIRHFDTARSYGLGDAEREVGQFVRRHRGKVTVGTKFGIQISRAGRLFKPVQQVARRVLGLLPALRKRIVRPSSNLVAPHSFDVPTARASLETSLRVLDIPCIDILFLHAPTIDSGLSADLADFLSAARARGEIRTWGLSGPVPDILPVKNAFPALAPVLQYECTALLRPGLPNVHGPQITFAPFTNALERISDILAASPAAAAAWRRDIDLPADPSTIAGLLLAEAIHPPTDHPVVFSTTRVDHLQRLVEAAYNPQERQRVVPLRTWIGDHGSPHTP